MTRPDAQEKDAASIQRALKELGKTADLMREREKKMDVSLRFQAVDSSSLESTYVVDPATTRWGPDLVPSTDMAPWPASVVDSTQKASTAVPMGLFPEIQHAWAVVDTTKLVLWDYVSSKDGVVSCPVVSSPIVSAGLVLPLPGTLFSDQVQYLLAVLTECDVRLFAVVTDKAAPTSSSSRPPWKVIDTLMTAPLANTQLATSLVCTPSRRILLGGVNGTLYEYAYSPNMPSADTVKFRRIQPATTSPWATYLPNVVRDLLFPSPNAAVASLVLDTARRLLYVTYVHSNVLSVYDIRSDIVLVSSVNLTDLARHALGNHVVLAPVVAIAPVEPASTQRVHVVALTSTGQRLALSFGPNYTLKALYLRVLPPPPSSLSTTTAFSSGGFTHIVAQPSGVCLLGHASAYQLLALVADAAAPPSTLVVETASTLPVRGTLHAVVAAAIPAPLPSALPPSSSSVGVKRSANGSLKPSSPLDFLKHLGSLGSQLTSPPPQFLAVSSAGVQKWTQTRLIDHVDMLLRRSASVTPVVEWYGAPYVAALLFGLPHNPAAAHAVCALDANDTVQGLAQYVAHLLAPLWATPVTKLLPSSSTATVLQTALDKLTALHQLVNQVVPLAVALHTDVAHLQPHHAVVRDLHALVRRVADALFGWIQLSTLLWKQESPLQGVPFHDVVGTDAGAAKFQAQLKDLAKDVPRVVPQLLAHCASFFSVWEAAPYQGLQTIAAAKAAATLAGRDALLQESLTQLRQHCAQWLPTKPTLQLLRHILKEYTAASFYYGMVELTVAVARVYTTTTSATSCYDLLLSLATTTEAQEAVAKYACQANDGGALEAAVLAWLPDLSVLQSCPFVRLSIHHHDVDDAAEYLWTQAHDLTSKRMIGERSALLARALLCVQVTGNAQHIADVQDALDVFNMQTRVYETLRHQKVPTGVLEALQSSILNMSTLFNEYAMPYGLHTECLRILHACQTNEPRVIASLWKQLIFGFVPPCTSPTTPAAVSQWLQAQHKALNQDPSTASLDGSFEDMTWVANVRSYMLQMGATLLHSGADYVFPVQELVETLETLHYYARLVVNDSLDSTWVAKLFVDLQCVSPTLLVSIYVHLKHQSPKSMELHWLLGMHAIVATTSDRHPFANLIHEHLDLLRRSYPDACEMLLGIE
ncbi:hypothetical protein DYB30_002237 [Aphanomyces astaci]|uniref:Uncharacterized protein n=2 Tax=Aphanomyces astaci TaxID=112090 RepID=A0A397DU07_APHAT|nr:hypothetical protein DYB36_001817 [Aphanomyces astaci]RHY42483.1 hypothetical protein DYB34_001908 [Aphanomyces astaci]RHY71054.1 hypothetical protein DYB30_002237 [Aphanomyces astaci]RHZ21875.1 hypothetical protein DYB31_004562 [Aphanomyces astaci]